MKINKEKLYKLRSQLGLSQRKFAIKAGVSNNTIQKIEQGIAPETKDYIAFKIAKALDCAVEYLLF